MFGAGNWTWILWKSSQCSSLWSRLSSPFLVDFELLYMCNGLYMLTQGVGLLGGVALAGVPGDLILSPASLSTPLAATCSLAVEPWCTSAQYTWAPPGPEQRGLVHLGTPWT